MSYNQNANQYKQMQIKTANRGQLLLMLYEGAIQNVKKASACIDRRDIAGKGQHIVKAHDIINELAATLDHEVGGDIARELERLYNFIGEQLVKANIENNKDCLAAVSKILENLLAGWRVAVAEAQKAAPAPSAGTAK